MAYGKPSFSRKCIEFATHVLCFKLKRRMLMLIFEVLTINPLKTPNHCMYPTYYFICILKAIFITALNSASSFTGSIILQLFNKTNSKPNCSFRIIKIAYCVFNINDPMIKMKPATKHIHF